MKTYISIVIAIILFGCVTTAYAGLADSPWPMYMHDARHTGRSEYVGPEYPSIKWEFYLEEDEGDAPPVVGADGTIYAVSVPKYDDTSLYAINPDGTLKWKVALGGNLYAFSPAIADDGTIYVNVSNKYLYAISPEGKRLWAFDTGDVNKFSPTIGPDGTIYFASVRGLWAISPDGTEKWHFPLYGYIISSPAIDEEGNIYINTNYDLYSISPNGEENWNYPVYKGGFSGRILTTSPSIGNDGTVYVGTGRGESPYSSGDIRALNPDGTLIWQTSMDDHANFAPAISDDGTIYASAKYSGTAWGVSESLYSIDPNGKRNWYFRARGPIPSNIIIDADGMVYFFWEDPCRTNYLYALYPDGTEKWRLLSKGWITSLCFGGDRIIYAKSGRYIYAIGEEDNIKVRLQLEPPKTCFSIDDNLKLLLDLKTPSRQTTADLYLALYRRHDDDLLFFPAWNQTPEPFLKNSELPPDLSLDDVTLLDLRLPSDSPPIKLSYNLFYTFLFFTTEPGTLNLSSNLALVEFEYNESQ